MKALLGSKDWDDKIHAYEVDVKDDPPATITRNGVLYSYQFMLPVSGRQMPVYMAKNLYTNK